MINARASRDEVDDFCPFFNGKKATDIGHPEVFKRGVKVDFSAGNVGSIEHGQHTLAGRSQVTQPGNIAVLINDAAVLDDEQGRSIEGVKIGLEFLNGGLWQAVGFAVPIGSGKNLFSGVTPSRGNQQRQQDEQREGREPQKR